MERAHSISLPQYHNLQIGSILNVRYGSGTDLRRHHQEGLLLEVKRTKSVGKRTLALECLLLGSKPNQAIDVNCRS